MLRNPKEKPEQLHKEALVKFDEYLKWKGQLSDEHHHKSPTQKTLAGILGKTDGCADGTGKAGNLEELN